MFSYIIYNRLMQKHTPPENICRLQRRLYQQVLPQFPVKAHVHIIARILRYQPEILLKRRAERNTAHRSVPFRVQTPPPVPVSHVHTQHIPFQPEMLGQCHIIIGK